MAEYSNGDDSKESREGKEECRDYKRNVCVKGDKCKYYHPPRDVNSIFERNSVCHDFQNPKGCQREACKFLHLTKEQEDHIRTNNQCPTTLPKDEMDKIEGLCKASAARAGKSLRALKPTPNNKRSAGHSSSCFRAKAKGTSKLQEPPFCNDYIRGTCNRGSSCKFRHVGDPGPVRGGSRGSDRYEPYRRPGGDDSFGRMEMKRRYREDMMEDEIMYLRAQVSRLKRQIADFAATNESLMAENARFRIDRTRMPSMDPLTSGYEHTARLPATQAPGPRAPGPPAEYNVTQARSAYPYTSGLKLEAAPLGGMPQSFGYGAGY